MKTRKLHMIGNAHIDPVWLGSGRRVPPGQGQLPLRPRAYEGISRLLRRLLRVGGGIGSHDVCRDPAARGRRALGIVGGWWVRTGSQHPPAESFVRHGLYGQRYFKEKFGVTAQTGFNVDSFGHAETLPQILKKERP